MGRQMSCNNISRMHCAIIFNLVIASTAFSDDTIPVPADKSQIKKWFLSNIRPHKERSGTLDPALDVAEATHKTIRVRKDGSGNFMTLTEAIKSIPSGNKQRVIVDIGVGVYNEKVTIDRTKPFITFHGSPNAMPILQFNGTANQYGTLDSATLIVESDYFIASNIIIKNTAPKPDGKRKGCQAVSLRITGDKAAFYRCKIYGYQDTVCDDRGRHFFYACYIEGSMDFIFGSGKSIYLQTRLHVLAEKWMTVITAQAKHSKSEDSGFSFLHCKITGDKSVGSMLGRVWMEMPEVVFAYTSMSDAVMPEAWLNQNHPERNGDILFGEYKNSGPGSRSTGRAKFSTQLDDSSARRFLSLGYIEASKWLLPPVTI